MALGDVNKWEDNMFEARVTRVNRTSHNAVDKTRSEEFAAVKKNAKKGPWTVIGYYETYDEAEKACFTFLDNNNVSHGSKISEKPFKLAQSTDVS